MFVLIDHIYIDVKKINYTAESNERNEFSINMREKNRLEIITN